MKAVTIRCNNAKEIQEKMLGAWLEMCESKLQPQYIRAGKDAYLAYWEAFSASNPTYDASEGIEFTGPGGTTLVKHFPDKAADEMTFYAEQLLQA